MPQKTLWEKATGLRDEANSTEMSVREELGGIEGLSSGECR